MSGTKTLAFSRMRDCLLYVGLDETPSDEDWAAYLEFLRAHARPHRLNRALVVPQRSIPTARQRRLLAEVVARLPIRVAVLTDSLAARGVVTALSWFNPGYRCFGAAALEEALAFLGYRDEALGLVRRHALQLKAELRGGATRSNATPRPRVSP